MTLDECRKVRDLLSLILASAKDKKIDLDIRINEHIVEAKPYIIINFK